MASQLTMEIRGLDEFMRRLASLSTVTRDETIGTALLAGALVLEGYAKAAIANPPKSGKIYMHGKVAHQASAPGEAPATDIGQLYDSFSTKRDGAEARVDVHSEYAEALEFGSSKMAARPYLRPAMDEHKDAIIEAVASNFEAAIQRAMR